MQTTKTQKQFVLTFILQLLLVIPLLTPLVAGLECYK